MAMINCIWVAEPSACKACRAVATQNGGVYKVGEVPSIPYHANCRCSKAAWYEEPDKKALVSEVENKHFPKLPSEKKFNGKALTLTRYSIVTKNQDEYTDKITPELLNSIVDKLKDVNFNGEENLINNKYVQVMYENAKKIGYNAKPTVISKVLIRYSSAGNRR